jgi:hypothetical protein
MHNIIAASGNKISLQVAPENHSSDYEHFKGTVGETGPCNLGTK